VIDVCFVCLEEVIIEQFCILSVALKIQQLHVISGRLDDVYFHSGECVYDLKYGRKSEVSVRLFVCCVTKTLRSTAYKQI
jgi:hypothetical protein